MGSELAHGAGEILKRAKYPFDEEFYVGLVAKRRSFALAFEHEMPRGTGYGFRVQAGQVWRLLALEGANALDVCVMNSDDPTEHYAPGTQPAIEGAQITRLTRIWGTPPRSRPLCTCITDTVRWLDNPAHMRDHVAHGAHCSPHSSMQYGQARQSRLLENATRSQHNRQPQ